MPAGWTSDVSAISTANSLLCIITEYLWLNFQNVHLYYTIFALPRRKREGEENSAFEPVTFLCQVSTESTKIIQGTRQRRGNSPCQFAFYDIFTVLRYRPRNTFLFWYKNLIWIRKKVPSSASLISRYISTETTGHALPLSQDVSCRLESRQRALKDILIFSINNYATFYYGSAILNEILHFLDKLRNIYSREVEALQAKVTGCIPSN